MSLLAGYYAAQNAELQAKTAATTAGIRTSEMAQQDSSATQAAQRGLIAAQSDATRAGAAKTTAETGQVGANGAAARGLDAANTANTQARTALLPGTTATDNALKSAQTGLVGAQASDLASNAVGANPLGGLPTLGGGLGLATGGGYVGATGVPLSQTGAGVDPQGDSTGGRILSKGEVAQGKAKKPGPTDTVPAMLTPGEAVLNKGAVSHYGSDVVDHMNKMGLLRMGAESEVAKAHGMADPHAAAAKGGDAKAKGGKGGGGGKAPAQGFARGTSKVLPLPALSATTSMLPPSPQQLGLIRQG